MTNPDNKYPNISDKEKELLDLFIETGAKWILMPEGESPLDKPPYCPEKKDEEKKKDQ